MSTFTPIYNKTPAENLVGLINQQNNKGYVVADLSIKAPVVLDTATANGNLTEVSIDLLNMPSEVDGDWVEFQYSRMSLTEVFSLVTAGGETVFREVDVPLDESGFPVDLDVFRAEILRKYSFLITAEDYDITLKQKGQIEIAAKAGNLAYIESFVMNVVDSLVTRVVNTTLVGFTADATELYVPEA